MNESLSAVHRRLRSAQKGRARGAPAYSVFVNRPIGRVFAAVAYRAGLTPNAVTLISAAFTFTGIVLLAVGPAELWLGVVVWLALAIGYALDSADGQVARLRGGGSPAGEWLDHFIDAFKISSLHAAVLIGLFRTADAPVAVLLIPILFGVVANVTFFGMILNDLLRAKAGAQAAADRGGGSWLRSVVLLPTDYGILCIAMVLWGLPQVFIPVYGALGACSFGFLVLAAGKWYRDISRLT